MAAELAGDLHVRIDNAATGELLRKLAIDPSRNYQPTGRPPGPTRNPTPTPQTEEPRTLGCGSGVVPTSREITGRLSESNR